MPWESSRRSDVIGDLRDGRIYTQEQVEAMSPEDRLYMRPMAYHPTAYQRAAGKIGRNDPCLCGSGKKFKRCCMWRYPDRRTKTGGAS